MSDLDEQAAALFERNRNAMGWPDPEWLELAEETRQVYRDEVRKRSAEVGS